MAYVPTQAFVHGEKQPAIPNTALGICVFTMRSRRQCVADALRRLRHVCHVAMKSKTTSSTRIRRGDGANGRPQHQRRTRLMASFDYDVIVIGSGFGGSVAALRATEEGLPVGVMEAGRRWKTKTFRRPTGISSTTCGSLQQKLRHPKDRVPGRCAHPLWCRRGGGSHVYGIRCKRPSEAVLRPPGWAGITDWPTN